VNTFCLRLLHRLGSIGLAFNAPDTVDQVTGSDGYVTVPIVFRYLASADVLNDTSVHVVFIVDNVSSNVSNVLTGQHSLVSSSEAAPCAFLRTLAPPPDNLQVGDTFSMVLMAVTAQGDPVEGAVARLVAFDAIRPSMYVKTKCHFWSYCCRDVFQGVWRGSNTGDPPLCVVCV